MTKHELPDDLCFPPGEPQGFSTLAMTQWTGNPEPVVRELLQNCLDAADEAGRTKSEVSFSIKEVPLADIPGIEAYREHFEQAVAEREMGTQGVSEKQVIKRIRQILGGGGGGGSVRLLFCRDNGVGLDSGNIERILTQGNTAKGQSGAGAFGIGHLTAFAASDLRYVLYAGRSRDPAGNTKDMASGHAILASCKKYKHGGHGYWLARTDSSRPPDLFDPLYPDKAPPLLLRELDCLGDTGSVVCITGFNNFRSDKADPAAAIARVAAKNFLVAIWNKKMTVTIRDEDDRETVVDHETLGTILERDKARKLGEQKGGWLPGAQAYQAWETLEQGERFMLGAGADAYVLPLGQHEARPLPRVQVFRSGMWITNDADALEPRRFRSNKPFAAVIMVESGGLARLVRGAEGPEHRGLDRQRLEPPDSKKLLALLQHIADQSPRKKGQEAKDAGGRGAQAGPGRVRSLLLGCRVRRRRADTRDTRSMATARRRPAREGHARGQGSRALRFRRDLRGPVGPEVASDRERSILGRRCPSRRGRLRSSTAQRLPHLHRRPCRARDRPQCH